MLLNDNVDQFLKVRISGEVELSRERNRLWGNVFLTDSWTLHIDLFDEQHNQTCERLGINEYDVLLSGRWEAFPLPINHNPIRVAWRSSPGCDSGKITEDENQMLMKAAKRVVIAQIKAMNRVVVIGKLNKD